MGTRHLTAVVADGDYKVAQYGQWDGYPSGQGKTVLDFLRRTNLNMFADKVRACTFIDADEIEQRWKSVGADDSGFVGMDVDDKFKANWPQLSRDIGAKVLEYIYNQPSGVELKNSLYFVADSLFCEWAYVIDLDKGTFEVYEGFNKKPLDPSERFADMPDDPDNAHRDERYYPVRLKTTYALDALPTDEQLLADNERADEDEES